MVTSMRRQFFLACSIGAGALAAGCFDVLSNPLAFHHGGQDEAFGTGGSGGSGGAGGTGGTPPGCIPSGNSTPVDDSCGVFVSSSKGSDTNDGTKERPFATIAKAIGAATGKPVLLCGETFAEAVEITA